MNGATGPAYRPDIDGLRALAVLPVVLFHAGVPGFGGGYVGVDVFFVISGYLITGIIVREIDAGAFSLAGFYERRARRILPALFAMLAAVLVLASLLYLPGDFERVPPSALATVLFAANVWFFSQSGYFSEAAEAQPLLHAWSLGVEEQFYIVFPLLLMALARLAPRLRVPAVATLLAASFALAAATQGAGDGFAFYLLPARGWELLVGAMLALGAVPALRGGRLREAAALGGLAAIAVPAVLYDSATVFPGIAAVPPVLGAALLIHAAPGTRVGRLLSAKPLVGIGLASYSLYLWHWPLIVFWRYAQDAPLAPWQAAAVIAASLALAAASLRWIERPWRDRTRLPRAALFRRAGAGLVGLAGVSAVLMTLGPWPGRFGPEVAAMGAARGDVSPVRALCLPVAYPFPDPRCTLGAAGAPDALVWGDSHAVEFAWALGERAARRGSAVVQRTHGSCPPLLGYHDPREPGCAAFNAEVLSEIARRPEVRTIYLAAYWAGGRYASPGAPAQLEATVARLQQLGRTVVLIGPVPDQPVFVPRALARSAAYGLAPPPSRTRAEHDAAIAWLQPALSRLRAQGVTVIDPAATLFAGERSLLVADGRPLYFDHHHLTLAGARRVLDKAGE